MAIWKMSNEMTMSAPLVSVIVPTFNRKDLVTQAVDSVLAQPEAAAGLVEILVVDDASEDGTAEILTDRYRTTSAVRRLRHSANRGVSAARNTGIDAARGRFVAFLDSDDIALADRLSRQIAQFAADPRLIAVGGAILVTEHDLTVREIVPYPETDLEIRWRGLFSPTLCLSATMMEASALRRTGVRFDESIGIAEDFDFLSAILAHGPAANLPEPVIKLRKHGGNSAPSSMEAYRRTLMRCVLRNFAAVGLPVEPTSAQEIYGFLKDASLPGSHIAPQVWAERHARARALLDAVARHSLPAPDRLAAIDADLEARFRLVREKA